MLPDSVSRPTARVTISSWENYQRGNPCNMGFPLVLVTDRKERNKYEGFAAYDAEGTGFRRTEA